MQEYQLFVGTVRATCVPRLSELTVFIAPHALDDFESLIYVVEYLIRGHLPWSHLIGTMRDRNYGPMLELQKPWAPENAALQEFLRYTRDLR